MSTETKENERLPRPPDVPPLPPRVGAVVDAACAAAVRRARGEETPLPTPWEGVNRLLFGGLWPGLYTLTSTTGIGKTQWVLGCALTAAKHIREERTARGEGDSPDGSGEVLIVALELSEVDVGSRVLGYLSRDAVAWRDLFYGRTSADRVMELRADVESELAALPLRVACVSPLAGDDASGPVLRVRTPGQLASIVRRMRPRLLVLDYVQLLDADNERDEIRQAIKHAAIVGREAARAGAVVLFVSSTARGNYSRLTGASDDKKAPPLGTGDAGRLVDLGKEAGELEFCADAALVLAAEPPEDESSEEPREDAPPMEDQPVWLAVAKGRGIGRGWHPMRWNGRRFRDADRGERRADFTRARAKKNGGGTSEERAPKRKTAPPPEAPRETAAARARRHGGAL